MADDATSSKTTSSTVGSDPVESGDFGRTRVVVLAGGDPLPSALDGDIAAAMDAASMCIAADSGIHHAHRAGRDPDVLIGDLDSVRRSALDRAVAAGTEIVRHPVDKDDTDLSLAVDLVLDRTADAASTTDVLVVGGHGGRSDHLLANLLLLSSERCAGLHITAWWGVEVLHIVRDAATLHGRLGSRVSLLAMHGDVRGVTTSGLHFPLSDDVLRHGSTLGISNRLTASPATVRVTEGTLAVLHAPPDPGPAIASLSPTEGT